VTGVRSETTTTRVEFDALIRDVRHRDARAASDLADWLEYLIVDGKSERTLYGYEREVAALLRACPEKMLHEITAADINGLLARKPEQSRYITRSILNSWFRWAEEDGRIERNPMVGRVPRMRPPRRRPRDIFSPEEVALLQGLASPDGHLYTILFGAGLRRGEARMLRREHIDLRRRRIIVYRGKGGKDRIVPIGRDVCAAIAELDLLEGLAEGDFVWGLVRHKRYRFRSVPIGNTTIDRWHARCCAQAGVRRLNLHQTRHTYGHGLRELGFDLEERQLLMGHEHVTTTQRYYGHLTVEDVARKMEEIGL
jgi:integrase/recombinase XerC